jgi:hypothetical protein
MARALWVENGEVVDLHVAQSKIRVMNKSAFYF